MAFNYWNRIKQTTRSAGTANYVLDLPVATYTTFADVMAVGDETTVCVVGAAGWEVVRVEMINSTTLARNEVVTNSLGNDSKIEWPDNSSKDIFGCIPAEYVVASNRTNQFTADQMMGLFRLLFGAIGNSAIRGSDGELRFEVGTGVALVLSSVGDLRLELDNDDGTNGRNFVLMTNSASPAVDDLLFAIPHRGKDSGGATQTYARARAKIKDPASGAHCGRYDLAVAADGVLTEAIVIDGDAKTITFRSGWTVIDEV